MNDRIERVLLLGHTGFIGSHVEEVFRGRFPSLTVVGRSATSFDLTRERDAQQLTPLLDLRTVAVVCAGVKRQLGDDLDTFSQNLQMVVNLCRVVQEQPVGRLVFLSSTAVYGEEIHNRRITEETPVQPTSYYGTAKYACERLLVKTFQSHAASSLLILRPPLAYGPGDSAGAYGPSGFVAAALEGETIVLWGDGTELREFLFVDDLAEVICRLALSPHTGVLNVASGTSYSYVDIVNGIGKALGTPIGTVSRPRTKAKADHGFSNLTFMAQLGAFSFTPLEEGIGRTIAAQSRSASSRSSRGGEQR